MAASGNFGENIVPGLLDTMNSDILIDLMEGLISDE